MLTSANQIIPAFNPIGTSLSKLRVAKQEKARPDGRAF
jgi:hypothetical protein